MSGIIKKYDLEGENSINNSVAYKQLEDRVVEIIKAEFPNYIPQKIDDIRNLIKPNIPIEVMREITRPWVLAISLAKAIEQMDTQHEKESSELLTAAIKSVKKYLPSNPTERQHFTTLMTSCEIDRAKIHSALDEILEHENIFQKLDFRNGEKTNPSYLKRYAIYALFYLGEQAGLKKIDKPQHLNKLVHILTDLEYKKINAYYSDYKKTTLKDTAGDNLFLNFIFNPNLTMSIKEIQQPA